MVRFDSWRAVSTGNGADRNLATKPTHGGRAIWQAVTRVKLEQASKAAMWTPTRRKIGEGGTDGEEPGRGGRELGQAVPRVKLERASKAEMWTPPRRKIGEGGTDGEEPGAGARYDNNRRAPIGSTGVVSTDRKSTRL